MKATKTATRIEARQSETVDAWTVGVFEFWTDLHGHTEAHLVEQVATFNTPDGDPLGIARAKEYADHLRTAPELARRLDTFKVTNHQGERVAVTIPEDRPGMGGESMTDEDRLEELEADGLTRSDAQAALEAENLTRKASAPVRPFWSGQVTNNQGQRVTVTVPKD